MTDKQKENKERILLALALLLGNMTQEEIAQTNTFADVPEEAQQKAIVEYKKHNADNQLDKLVDKEKLGQPEIQKKMAEIGQSTGAKYYVIANPGDGKTCEACKKWIGKVVSDEDKKYPSTQDWIKSGGLHFGCRCSLHEKDEANEVQKNAQDYLERKRRRLEEAAAFEAFNSTPMTEFVFN